MALSDFINYSSGSDLLAKRLAQQIGQANQEQALRQNQMQAALQQQLAPLRQQEQALQVQALQQQLDPVLQEQAFQQKMQQAVALQNATQLAKLNAVGEFSPGTLVGTPEEVRAGKGFLVPGKPAATQFVGTGTGEGGALVGTIYDPNTQTFVNKPLPTGFQTKGAKAAGKTGLTPAQQFSSFARAGKAGLDPSSKNYINPQTGELDYLKLAADVGVKENEQFYKKLEDSKKLKPPTGEQLKAAGFAERLLKTEAVFSELEQKGFQPQEEFGVLVSRYTPNLFKSEDLQRLERSQRDFLNAKLRDESGAAIGKDEFESGKIQYFPQYGDSEGVIEDKRQNRLTVINGMKNQALGGRSDAATQSAPQGGGEIPAGMKRQTNTATGEVRFVPK